jgi:hypothetical protein
MADVRWGHAQAYVDMLYGEVAEYVPRPVIVADPSAEVVEAIIGRISGEIVAVDEPQVEFITDWAMSAA